MTINCYCRCNVTDVLAPGAANFVAVVDNEWPSELKTSTAIYILYIKKYKSEKRMKLAVSAALTFSFVESALSTVV